MVDRSPYSMMMVAALLVPLLAGHTDEPRVNVTAKAEPLAAILRQMSKEAGVRLTCDDALAQRRLVVVVCEAPLSETLAQIAWATRSRVAAGREGPFLQAVPMGQYEAKAWEQSVDRFLASLEDGYARGREEIERDVQGLAQRLSSQDSEDAWGLSVPDGSELFAAEALASIGRQTLRALGQGRHVFSTSPTLGQRPLPSTVFAAYRAYLRRARWFNDALGTNGIVPDADWGPVLYADEAAWVEPERIDLAVVADGTYLFATVSVVGRDSTGRRIEHAGFSFELERGAEPEASLPDLDGPWLDAKFMPTEHESWFWETFHRFRERARLKREDPPGGEFADFVRHEPMASFPAGLMERLAMGTGRNVVADLGLEPFHFASGSGPAADVTVRAALELYSGSASLEWSGEGQWIALRPLSAGHREFSRPLGARMLALPQDVWPSLETAAEHAALAGDEATFLETWSIVRGALPLSRPMTLDYNFWGALAYSGLPAHTRLLAQSPDGVMVRWASLPPGVARTISDAVYREGIPMHPPSPPEARWQQSEVPEGACESDMDPTRVAPLGIPATARLWVRRGSDAQMYRVDATDGARRARPVTLEQLAHQLAAAELAGTGPQFRERLGSARFFDGERHWVEFLIVGEGWELGPCRWEHDDGLPGKVVRRFAQLSEGDQAEFRRMFEAELARKRGR
jgi:hypothetical protein